MMTNEILGLVSYKACTKREAFDVLATSEYGCGNVLAPEGTPALTTGTILCIRTTNEDDEDWRRT